ncbi:MAG: COG1615 family transporter, partial [Gemmatimonadetes bacterium]|nr:COG1615 family transporter [Gemmatimonadota bacterium]
MSERLRMLRGGRFILVGLGVLLLLLIASRALTSLYVEALWFGSVGYEGVFWKQFAWVWGSRAGAMVVVTLALFFN